MTQVGAFGQVVVRGTGGQGKKLQEKREERKAKREKKRPTNGYVVDVVWVLCVSETNSLALKQTRYAWCSGRTHVTRARSMNRVANTFGLGLPSWTLVESVPA